LKLSNIGISYKTYFRSSFLPCTDHRMVHSSMSLMVPSSVQSAKYPGSFLPLRSNLPLFFMSPIIWHVTVGLDLVRPVFFVYSQNSIGASRLGNHQLGLLIFTTVNCNVACKMLQSPYLQCLQFALLFVSPVCRQIAVTVRHNKF